jgi:uncharacterized protein YjiS (DUF1127 family)
MTTIALSKAPGGSPPLRHGGALEGLSDAGQWVLDTLREWLQRSRERHQLAELGQRMLRHIEVPRSVPIHLSNKPFWKE